MDVTGIRDSAQRVEVIRRRREYERDPERFRESWKPAEEELAQAILRAEKLLPRVAVDDETLEVIAALSVDLGADGHRADLAMIKAVSALAAFPGPHRDHRRRRGRGRGARLSAPHEEIPPGGTHPQGRGDRHLHPLHPRNPEEPPRSAGEKKSHLSPERKAEDSIVLDEEVHSRR